MDVSLSVYMNHLRAFCVSKMIVVYADIAKVWICVCFYPFDSMLLLIYNLRQKFNKLLIICNSLSKNSGGRCCAEIVGR